MSPRFSDPKRLRVAVVDPRPVQRSVVADALREHGISPTAGLGDLKAFLEVAEVEIFDWVVTPVLPDATINALHILKLCTEFPALRRLRVSVLTHPGDLPLLPLAFELGLMSWHDGSVPGRLKAIVADFFTTVQSCGANETLIAATYLRVLLKDSRRYDAMVKLNRTLLEMNPGSTEILLSLAESQILAGLREEGRATLAQVKLIDVSAADRISCTLELDESEPDGDISAFGMEEPGAQARPSTTNALGVERCMVVDPDSTVQYAVGQLLADAGVPQVLAFTNGDEAWAWVDKGGRPDLVLQEWRVMGLSGSQFLQRVRQKGLIAVPIIVISSLVTDEDRTLLREMGVATIIEKPFDSTSFFSQLIWTLQQQRSPTEQISLERKILVSLQCDNTSEAQRLRAMYLNDPDFDDDGKIRVNAEFAFHGGDFELARDLAIQALRQSRDSLELLNLLGKALMRLGDHDAALQCFHKAEILSPKNVERLCRISTLSLAAGKEEEAEAFLTKAKSIDCGNRAVADAESAIALSANDVPRARRAFAGLDSMNRILAFMNNKAVALVRCGRFEDGMQLYRCALDALPKPWNPTHDAVSYNLGLAYARYSEPEQALRELDKIVSGTSTPLGRKAISLKRRIREAVEKGTPLSLGGEAQDNSIRQTPPLRELPTDVALRAQSMKIIASIVPTRGDICCYRIFVAGELLDPRAVKLLQDKPTFRERGVIERQETMKVKPGGAC